jgi:hypothetical protein
MKRIKVRFHLGKGKNFMKWQITHADGNKSYHEPTEVQLILTDCQLKNSVKVAKKIFEGGEKVVCAWVLCEGIVIRKAVPFGVDSDMRVKYNPRVTPNWVLDGVVVDGCYFKGIMSDNRGLFITKK